MKPMNLKDLKTWYAISCPTTGVRFDLRMLALMDSNGDGHVRTDEVQAALDYMKGKGVSFEDLFKEDPEAAKKLDEVLAKQAALEKLEPSADEKAALAAWEKAGQAPEVAVCGEGTAAAEAALAAVEKTIDAFFTPPEDMPLVTEEPDRDLPLADHLNPKHLEAILGFAEKCVKPVLGADKTALSRMDWKKVKAAFAPYRAWVGAKPVLSAAAKAELEDQERFLRYRLHLAEFLENYITMDRLYEGKELAIFQTGILRIDGREMNLCFHVDSEAAHSALAEKSSCCVIYLKLTQPDKKAERNLCAVVTAGTVGGLYVGRNGVFYDRDGGNWEAVVTKVVEAQVSLVEAFWAPWRKLGEGIAATVKKFLGDKQDAAMANVQKGTESTQAGGAAMASSVAAIGIGVGMIGAAAASIMAAVSSMSAWQLIASVFAIVLVVSLPSVILTWFKLRRRDIGAILNASGWAVNRQMRFSMKRARGFTKCAPGAAWWVYVLLILLVVAVIGGLSWWNCGRSCGCPCDEKQTQADSAPAATQEVQK